MILKIKLVRNNDLCKKILLISKSDVYFLQLEKYLYYKERNLLFYIFRLINYHGMPSTAIL